MENIKTVWEFVEKYYADYSSSDEIAHNEDYHKILEGQINGCAEDLYNEIKEGKAEHFAYTLDQEELESEVLKEVQQLYDSSIAEIYEEAIKGFLENSKPKEIEKTFYLIGGDATREYDDNGIEGVVKEYEADELTISVFCFIEGETRSHELADALNGWDDYVIITEEEFNQIN